MVNVFAVPVFFVLFRETLETAIIVSVLLSFLKQTLHPVEDKSILRKLRIQVWLGTAAGILICAAIGGGVIGAFYGLKKTSWSGAEEVWEGAFALIASVIITLMGAALLRISKMRGKWRDKLAKALEPKQTTKGGRLKKWAEKYAIFLLPFITVLREGVEAIIFIGGVTVGQPASAFPLPVIAGIAAGSLVGLFLYKGGNHVSLQIFLIISTAFLYLVAAGLASKGVWHIEADRWNKASGGDAAENGAGPGSYDIRQSVWHINCCSPNVGGGGGWGIFNALFGWTNSATYGSVIMYNLYWVVVISAFLMMRYRETGGRWPFQKARDNHPGHRAGSVSPPESPVEPTTIQVEPKR